jgi:hypothetical protein
VDFKKMQLARNTVIGQQPEKSIDPEELRYNPKPIP